MKTIKFLPALVFASILTLSGCFIDINDDDGLFGCFDADGPITTAELEIAEFDKIELAMEARVEITQGDEQIVTFEGKSDILDELDLDIRNNGTWVIRTEDCVRDVDDLTFYITTPNLESIEITGSGNILSTNTLIANDIDLRISGSGEMDLGLEADDVEVEITGSGDIFVEGVADEVDVRITGSGDFEGFNFECNRADARISGSGDIEVRVNDRLTGRITGSGDIRYKGRPDIDVEITGSGDVVDAN